MPSITQPLAPLDDPQLAVRLLSEVTGMDRAEVIQRLRAEQQRLGANVAADLAQWGVTPFEWSDDLIRFYCATNAFLFESFLWNRQPTKQGMRRWIIQFLKAASNGPLQLLAYGDGLGFDSAALSRAGHEVTYFEVGEKSRRFAEQVFQLNNATVRVVEREADLQPGSFDAVVCLDVLEHVPDPPTSVHRLAELLRPGGQLLVSAPFWYLHPDVPTHLRSNLRYAGNLAQLYYPAGLREVDAAPFWNPLVLRKVTPGETHRPTAAAWRRIRLAQAILTIGRWRPQLLCRIYSPIARRELRRNAHWLNAIAE